MTIRDLLHDQTRETPDDCAIGSLERDPLTFSRLMEQIDYVVAALNRSGVGQGDRVALVLSNGPEMAVAFVATASGATCAPLNPAYSEREFEFYLGDLAAKAVIVQSGVDSPVRRVAQCLEIPIIDLVSDTHAEAGIFTLESEIRSTTSRPGFAVENQVALVLHTSGTTARAKMTPLTHANLVASAHNVSHTLQLSCRDRCLNVMPLFHIHGLVGALLSSLSAGAEVICTPGFDAAAFFEWLDVFKPTWYTAVPTIHQAILGQTQKYPEVVAECQLRFIRSSSSALPPPVMAELERVFRAPVIESYGMTEAAHQMASNPLPPRQRKPGSVGLAAGPEIAVLGEEMLEPLAVGAVGELAVRGPNVTAGYIANPSANESAFVNGWFRTGDQGYVDDTGYVFVTGRLKEMINRGGQKIAPREIDEVLMGHPDVVQAVAFATPHSSLGEDVAVAVVLREESAASEAELRTFAFSHLAEYKVPGRIVIVDAIPKGPTGKVQRIGLSEQLASLLHTEFAAPGNAVEEALVQFWVDVLNVQNVGISDNFFWIGGDSIAGAQLLDRANSVFQIDLPLGTVFKYPTVEGQAAVVTNELVNDFDGLPDDEQAWLQKRVQRALARGDKSQTIPHRTTGIPIPLSAAQKRMWIYQELNPGGLDAVRPVALRLEGAVDERAVACALNEIVKRHEVLRTVYRLEAEEPIQIPREPEPVPLQVVDLRSESDEHAEAALRQIGLDTAAQVVNLAMGPIVTAALIRLDDEKYRLLLMVHHIAFDGWSEAILIRELAHFYSVYFEASASILPELPMQYTDFASWQDSKFGAGVARKHVEYWKRKLENMPPDLALLSDYVDVSPTEPKRRRRSFTIPLSLTRQLEDLTRHENVTLFMVLMAAFKTLLYRYTRQNDITIGTIAAGRSHAELSSLIGCFISVLPIRTDLSGDPTFRELLGRVRETTLEFYAHQNLPTEQLSGLLASDGHMSRSPVYQVLFQYRNFKQIQHIRAGNLFLERDKFHIETETWTLAVEISRSEEGLNTIFDLAADQFLPGTAARMENHYRTLLAGIASNPDQRVSRLPLLTEAERHQLLVKWNDTYVDFPAEKCIHKLFEEQAKRTPDAMAVLFKREQITYAELNTRANQLANRLHDLGVGPEVLVGICVERSLEMIVGLLGVLKAGGAYLPLDPAYPPDRLAFMLADSRTPVLLTQERLVEKLPAYNGHLLRLDVESTSIVDLDVDNPVHHAKVESLAYVIYTSGSTGKPKGVEITHRAMANLVFSAIDVYGIRADDRILQFSSISFDAAIEEIFPSLITGSSIVLRDDNKLLTADALWRLCEDWRITIVSLPTSLWHQLGLEMSTDNSVLPEALRIVIIGGEHARTDSTQRWVKIATRSNYIPRLVNGYGPTETTVVVTSYELMISDAANTQEICVLPIGRPVANTVAYILDPQMQAVPIGVPGELHIGGIQVARGYLNRPDLTSEKFIRNPFSDDPAARLYKTGDLVRYLPDGNIEYLGRIDNQVKVRGYRIELGEIESVLQRHPAIREAIVVAREDPSDNKQLVAYVVFNVGLAANSVDLREALRSQLPEFMMPSAFVPLNTFPLMPNGKVDRGALPAPEDMRPELIPQYEPPATEIEIQLAQIWCNLLAKRQVGRREDIFNLGGHSLTLAQLAARIQDKFGVEVPLRLLFNHRTIEKMALVILGQLLQDTEDEDVR